jgi:hypothetical protein
MEDVFQKVFIEQTKEIREFLRNNGSAPNDHEPVFGDSGTGMKTSHNGDSETDSYDEDDTLAAEILKSMGKFTMKDFMNQYVTQLQRHNEEYLEFTDLQRNVFQIQASLKQHKIGLTVPAK